VTIAGCKYCNRKYIFIHPEHACCPFLVLLLVILKFKNVKIHKYARQHFCLCYVIIYICLFVYLQIHIVISYYQALLQKLYTSPHLLPLKVSNFTSQALFMACLSAREQQTAEPLTPSPRLMNLFPLLWRSLLIKVLISPQSNIHS
jgi:hypothetical protein